MKLLLVFASVLVVCSLVEGQGFPTRKCPAGEHSVLYCPQKAEPSCDDPTVHDLGPGAPAPCGVPQCFCDTPTVRNLKSGKCVKNQDCPKKN